ncbi:hypothetical protein JOD55_000436 [Arcanobacterium pluranimalium]|uniref:DUF6270 domain-containing protein n=1 Tax=Arcanobacterium pluranimalium TaxID=108028 RepID=UPI0019568E27|nr:DUF6270 domain-containing protein [Arcanobacterium pluranimalium]MBM7824609.1 hypothetical protein [Arcanobacterium pluranimalium]
MSNLKIFYYGSSLFTHLRKYLGPIEVVGHVNLQSVISGMSRPWDITSAQEWAKSDSGNRAQADMRSVLADAIRIHAPKSDLVLWDIIDERFGVASLNDNAFRTLSGDYTGLEDPNWNPSAETPIPFGSDLHFQLFQFYASRLTTLFEAVGIKDRVVVLAPTFADSYEDGSPLNNTRYSASSLDNSFARYWKYLADICNLKVFAWANTTAEKNHPWGDSPFHFSESTLEQISTDIVRYHDKRLSRKQTPRFTSIEALLRNNQECVIEGGAGGFSVLINVDGRSSDSRLLVVFSGAVSNRNLIHGPVYSGRDLAQTASASLISIADPTLELKPQIPLAWYVGNEGINLQDTISRFLLRLHKETGRELLLVGGSGGGFAVIDQLIRLPEGSAYGLVWNPQTDLAHYGENVVNELLATAFPSFFFESANLSFTEKLSRLQRSRKIRTNLVRYANRHSLHHLICLQQENDWHLQSHFIPLFQALNAVEDNRKVWFSGDNDVYGIVKRYGETEHLPPDRELLDELISEALVPSRSISSWIENTSIFRES